MNSTMIVLDGRAFGNRKLEARIAVDKTKSAKKFPIYREGTEKVTVENSLLFFGVFG
jgi:hypothetical protein